MFGAVAVLAIGLMFQSPSAQNAVPTPDGCGLLGVIIGCSQDEFYDAVRENTSAEATVDTNRSQEELARIDQQKQLDLANIELQKQLELARINGQDTIDLERLIGQNTIELNRLTTKSQERIVELNGLTSVRVETVKAEQANRSSDNLLAAATRSLRWGTISYVMPIGIIVAAIVIALWLYGKYAAHADTERTKRFQISSDNKLRLELEKIELQRDAIESGNMQMALAAKRLMIAERARRDGMRTEEASGGIVLINGSGSRLLLTDSEMMEDTSLAVR